MLPTNISPEGYEHRFATPPRLLACAFLLSLVLGAQPARAQADALASAHDALKAGDLAVAAQGHRDYLKTHPDAPDASKEALHLAWILYKEKVPDTEIRQAFQDVCDQYAGTAQAATAGFALANYRVKDKRYDRAVQEFARVAAEPNAPPDLAAEALLETGFMHIENYFAREYFGSDGDPVTDPTDSDRIAMLNQAAQRLADVAAILASREDDTGTCRTAAAYAECGVGEVEILLGRPYRAEKWYQSALKRCEGAFEPPVRTLATLGLGAALYHEGRYLACIAQMDRIIREPVTGKVLYSLVVPDYVVAHAHLWKAASYRHLGRYQEALFAADRAAASLASLGSSPATSARMTAEALTTTKLVDTWVTGLTNPSSEYRDRIATTPRSEPLPGGAEIVNRPAAPASVDGGGPRTDARRKEGANR
jgi:tetratricopeptide (TPR) repeat protein